MAVFPKDFLELSKSALTPYVQAEFDKTYDADAWEKVFMSEAEKMAADIALAMNGGEWKDGKWYSKGHREAWIKAVKPYADEIERLRERDGFIAILDKQIVEKDAEIERLRDDLSFAVQIMRSAPVTFTSDDGMKFYDEAVEKLARSALQQKESE